MADGPPQTAAHTYEQLREQAEACTGEVSSARRIQEIECRYGGADHLVRIGGPGTMPGATVAAIFQLGRDTFTIHSARPGELPDSPVVLNKRDVYAFAEFD